MKDFQELSARFSKYMTNKGLKVNKMASELEFSGSQISNIRNGKVFGTDKMFKILNTYTDLDANWLFRGEQESNTIKSSNSDNITLIEENKELTKENIELLKENRELFKEIKQLQQQLIDLGNYDNTAGRSVG